MCLFLGIDSTKGNAHGTKRGQRRYKMGTGFLFFVIQDSKIILLENSSFELMVDGGGCGLFLQWGIRCFWVEPSWVENDTTQLQFGIDHSDIQGDFFNWFRP